MPDKLLEHHNVSINVLNYRNLCYKSTNWPYIMLVCKIHYHISHFQNCLHILEMWQLILLCSEKNMQMHWASGLRSLENTSAAQMLHHAMKNIIVYVWGVNPQWIISYTMWFFWALWKAPIQQHDRKHNTHMVFNVKDSFSFTLCWIL